LTPARTDHRIRQVALKSVAFQPLLPPRSMVGHLPLEQVIGVRIPGGQPNSDSIKIQCAAMLLGHRQIDIAQNKQDGENPNQGIDFANLAHGDLHHRIGNQPQA
jgi:hypothetical protein